MKLILLKVASIHVIYRLTNRLKIELLLTYHISSSSTSCDACSSKTRSQVIKQQGLLFIYTNVYMLVKMFDQLIDQALTRSPVKRAHSHTIHQVFTRNNVQHETTFTDDDIGIREAFSIGRRTFKEENLLSMYKRRDRQDAPLCLLSFFFMFKINY